MVEMKDGGNAVLISISATLSGHPIEILSEARAEGYFMSKPAVQVSMSGSPRFQADLSGLCWRVENC